MSRIEKNGGSWRLVLQRGVAHDFGSEDTIHLLPCGGETSQLPDGLLCFVNLAGCPRPLTAKGNGAATMKGVYKERGGSLSDIKDVISKPRNEQHLFTLTPKY